MRRLRYRPLDESAALGIIRGYLREHPAASEGELFEVIAPLDSPSVRRALLLREGPLEGVLTTRAAHPTGWLSPLFSPEFYRWQYADVARAGLDAWYHYQAYGAAEGRQPHPLLDPVYLGQWMPAEPRHSVVDRYLIDPATWWMEPSPFSRVSRFLLEVDLEPGRTPLEQMLVSADGGRWFAFQLLVSATDSGDRDAAHWAAAALLSSRGIGTLTAELTVWSTDSGPATDAVSVVPGFFAGSGGAELVRIGDEVISPDGTVVRLHSSHVSTNAHAGLISAPSVTVLDGPIDHLAAQRLVRDLPPGSAIAPASPAQQVGFQGLMAASSRDDIVVLDYGKQVTSTSAIVTVDSSPMPEQPALWAGEVVGTVFLLAPAHLAVADREKVERALIEGAEFGGSLLNSSIWAALLSRARTIVVTSVELDAVRVLVAPELIRIIGGIT